MMTKKHARYLREYAHKTGEKRRLRRIQARRNNETKHFHTSSMRRALSDYLKSRPAVQPTRAGSGSGNTLTKIKNFFKPSI